MKKLGALLLLIAMVFTCTACGGGNNDNADSNKPGVLTISVYKGGYGVDWINEVANKFKAETGIEVKVNDEYVGQAGITKLRSEVTTGETQTDLIISKDVMFDEIYKGKKEINGVQYDNLFEDLTDLYNTKVTGEEVTLKEKMDPLFAEYYNVEGKYYATPWASGMIGLIRNKDVWKEEWEVPNTTDQLFVLADKIKASNIAPFIYSEKDEYWSLFSHVWIAQHKGTEEMKKFYEGYDADGLRYTENLFEDDSFYSTLKILERLLANDNGYMHKSSKVTDFTNMQRSFLQGNAVMAPNGDWIEREMKTSKASIEFLKTPVNSAVANKCSFKNEANKDEILSDLIDFVDGKSSVQPANTTAEDLEIVKDARSIEYTGGNEHYMAIPAYAKEKEEAKKFILFMASDNGIKTYVEKTGGCLLPYKYDYSAVDASFSDFRKTTSAIIDSSTLMFASKKDRIFSLGGVDMYWYNNKDSRVVVELAKKGATNAADKIIARNKKYLQDNLEYIKKVAGISL